MKTGAMSDSAMTTGENPFSSRFTRPGMLPFVFANDETAAAIVERFIANKRRGAIVGPHGSGKSTLLATLRPSLAEIGLRTVEHSLHDGQRRLPRNFASLLTADAVLVVDGYEQLGWWGRYEVSRAVRRCSCGLLATSHAAVAGLPTLFTTRPDWNVARKLISQLAGNASSAGDAAAAEQLFHAERGNVRELFFRLYDLYESRRV